MAAAGVRLDAYPTHPRIDTVIVGAGYPVEYLGCLRRSWAVATPALREWIGTRMECIEALHGPSAMLYRQDRIADVANIGQRTRMQKHDVRSAHKAVV